MHFLGGEGVFDFWAPPQALQFEPPITNAAGAVGAGGAGGAGGATGAVRTAAEFERAGVWLSLYLVRMLASSSSMSLT